jgi:hypothetical protein
MKAFDFPLPLPAIPIMHVRAKPELSRHTRTEQAAVRLLLSFDSGRAGNAPRAAARISDSPSSPPVDLFQELDLYLSISRPSCGAMRCCKMSTQPHPAANAFPSVRFHPRPRLQADFASPRHTAHRWQRTFLGRLPIAQAQPDKVTAP